MLILFIKKYKLFLVNVGEDCPVFDGLYEFCQLSSGGSLCKIYFYFNLDNFFYFTINKFGNIILRIYCRLSLRTKAIGYTGMGLSFNTQKKTPFFPINRINILC